MAKYGGHCRVCGKSTFVNVQATNFYPKGYRKGVKARFESCCPECKEEYSNNIKKYCSLDMLIRILLIEFKITRLDWQNQGGE